MLSHTFSHLLLIHLKTEITSNIATFTSVLISRIYPEEETIFAIYIYIVHLIRQYTKVIDF